MSWEAYLYHLLALDKIETWHREAAHRRDVITATARAGNPRVPVGAPTLPRTVWPLSWAQRGAELVLGLRIR